MRAHALGAVHISVLRVTDAATNLIMVESVVIEALLELGELHVLVRELSGTEGKLVDHFAGSMSGAVIRARGALASLAFVALKALTLARLTVAKTLASALRVSVASIVVGLRDAYLRVVHPRDLVRADSLGAITGVMRHTNTPIVIADTSAHIATVA